MKEPDGVQWLGDGTESYNVDSFWLNEVTPEQRQLGDSIAYRYSGKPPFYCQMIFKCSSIVYRYFGKPLFYRQMTFQCSKLCIITDLPIPKDR
jgi:hypothetical protein